MPSENTDNIVIVIDPGHGGENLGGVYESFLEKDMTMIVADAMKDELSKYEGVTVYLTHSDDRDMSLKERADFAKDVNADFLFCLHFNKSVRHDLYGSEVWISAFGKEYAEGMSYARIHMQAMEEMGIFSRGIKTKVNDRGTDWYGILRNCTENGVSSALIEHCHIDNKKDSVFCDSDEELKAFGKADATCAAKFFHLKSNELGVDYSTYDVHEIPIPAEPVLPDTTEPEISMIELVSADYETGEVTLQISGEDPDSPLMYFSYSINGGQSYSELKPWPGTDTFEFSFYIPSGYKPYIIVRTYNLYDLFKKSNCLVLDSFEYACHDEDADTSLSANTSVSGEISGNGPFSDTTVGTAEQPWKPYVPGEEGKEGQGLLTGFLFLALLTAGIVLLSAFCFRTFRSRKKKGKRK